MENLQIFFYSLKLFFSGIIVYSVIQFAFIYNKMPQKITLASLIVSSIALVYILSDIFISVFTTFIPEKDTAVFLLLFKEIIPLLFIFLFPYFVGLVYELTPNIKKINRIFFFTGIIAVLAITASGFIMPDLFLKNQYYYTGIQIESEHINNTSLLLIIRNLLLFIYLIYSIIILLKKEIQNKTSVPITKILIGLLVISYIAFIYFFIAIFSGKDFSSLYNGFPFMSFSIAILIIFMTFAIFELFINYNTQLVNIENKIRKDLYYDPEIGVQNITGFRKELQMELNKSVHTGKNIALIFFDIDDFKNINESYGESVGDEILNMLSLRMTSNFKPLGRFYRIGGDDFVFISPGINTDDDAKIFASKILTSLRVPFQLSDMSYLLTVSIAILLVPRDGNDLDSIMNNAYSTIHIAKKNKNSYEFFSRELQEGSFRKIHAVNLLRNCISKDEFVLFYHPMFNSSGKIEYVEALLRCTNADPNIGGPGNFLPLIEKAGLMKEIDNFVVRNAFYDMEMKIKNRIGISINLSTRQIVDSDYGGFLASFAKQHRIDPSRIILEITESTLVENILLAHKSLSELKRNGFLIAIDDFGKGFSSLSYLADLPVDIIKIDMAFVQSIPGEEKKELLAKYIMELGKSLNLTIIAEGFELIEQVEFFKKLDCNFYQGFYFARPMPIQDLLTKYLLK